MQFLLSPENFDYTQVDFSNYMWGNFARNEKYMKYFVANKDAIIPQIKERIKKTMQVRRRKEFYMDFCLIETKCGKYRWFRAKKKSPLNGIYSVAMSFCFGFRRPKGGSILRNLNAQGYKASPAQFPACGREFTHHSARGPEGPSGDSPATVPSIQNIDFNRPLH